MLRCYDDNGDRLHDPLCNLSDESCREFEDLDDELRLMEFVGREIGRQRRPESRVHRMAREHKLPIRVEQRCFPFV